MVDGPQAQPQICQALMHFSVCPWETLRIQLKMEQLQNCPKLKRTQLQSTLQNKTDPTFKRKLLKNVRHLNMDPDFWNTYPKSEPHPKTDLQTFFSIAQDSFGPTSRRLKLCTQNVKGDFR